MKRCLFILFIFFLSLPYAHAILLNKIVATCDDEVLTLWEVERELQVDRVKRNVSPDQPITITELKEFTKKRIIESIVLKEIKSFKLESSLKENATHMYAQFKNKFKNKFRFNDFMLQYQWRDVELKNVLTRSRLVEHFIQEKISSMHLVIVPQEIKEFQKSHNMDFKSAEIALKKERLESNLKDWVMRLKAQHRITMLLE